MQKTTQQVQGEYKDETCLDYLTLQPKQGIKIKSKYDAYYFNTGLSSFTAQMT